MTIINKKLENKDPISDLFRFLKTYKIRHLQKTPETKDWNLAVRFYIILPVLPPRCCEMCLERNSLES